MNVDKLKTVPADLSKLSNIVDNDVVITTVHNKLVINFNAINAKILSTSGLLTKTQYDSNKQGLGKKIEDNDKKILSTSDLVKSTGYNTINAEI